VAGLSVWEGQVWAIVVPRRVGPSSSRWELPYGRLRVGEPLDSAAQRVLEAEAAVKDVFLEQLYTFGEPHRDPRGHILAVAYYALIDGSRLQAARSAGSSEVGRVHVPWSGEAGGPVDLVAGNGRRLGLAFDHADILGLAIKRIRGKLNYAPIGFQLLPRRFTLLELQRIHEAILARPVNKDSFRRRMLASGLLKATGRREADVDHRPAELYRFVRSSAI
jgi:8-oxo-dGTP diphosphatase